MCEPVRIAGKPASRPSRLPIMLPAASMRTRSPAAFMRDATYSRPATSAALKATRLTPPSGFAPKRPSSRMRLSSRRGSARGRLEAVCPVATGVAAPRRRASERRTGLTEGEYRVRLPERVKIVEVGPRDGLQNEAARVSVDDRVAFCDALLDAGLPVVEVGAFVSPKWVPQMAGSDEVLRRVRAGSGARTPVLVPNRKGYEAAREAGSRAI